MKTPPHQVPTRRAASRSRLLGGIAAVAALSLLPTVAPAGAARGDDSASLQELQRRRDQIRREKAQQASEVNALEGTDAEVSAALAALNADVSAQRDRVEEAERAVSQAESDQQAAEAAQARKQAELDEITARMKESAVEAYVRMGSSSDALSTLGSDDVNDAVKKRTLLSMRANENIDLVERFRSVQEDLEIQRKAAQEAAERAAKHREEVDQKMGELEAAYAKQQAFAEQVEARLDAALAEAASLAELDSGLSNSIRNRQAEIARAAQRAAEAAARAMPSRSRGGGGGGGGGGGPVTVVGSGSIVSVGGIRVHQSIAGNLQALLSAASAAGIHFGGGGYRDSSGQIATRRNNCGSSHYDIYEKPASACSPPTARPGRSMHERGLAIDFTQGGSTLTRSSSGFHWLKANAASYGFYNLPSEPWHWSTNGN